MIKDKIYVKWYKDDNPNMFNFGDDLGPYIISKLSGEKVFNVPYANSRIKVLWQGIIQLKKRGITICEIKKIVNSFFIKSYIISTGSILHLYTSKRCNVWGSGILDKMHKVQKSNFLAVRGMHTYKKLLELGFKPKKVLGDPALLLPIIYNPHIVRKYKLGIIPHYTHYDLFKNNCINNDILIVNLNQQNIEKIIDEILSCEKTISTSLHGIIVSHAYKIPSLWFCYTKMPLRGDNTKFLDYFSSVEIPDYDPFNFDLSRINNIDFLLSYFYNSKDIEFVRNDIIIEKLQRNLISVAPFSVKEEYLNY